MYQLIYKIPGPTVGNMGKKFWKELFYIGKKKCISGHLHWHIILGIAPSSYKQELCLIKYLILIATCKYSATDPV